jgi:hypothetical protein
MLAETALRRELSVSRAELERERSEKESLRSQVAEANVSFQAQLSAVELQLATSQRALGTLEEEKVLITSLSSVYADAVVCLQRGLEDSLKRLAESDRLKDERLVDFSKQLEDLEASRVTQVRLLTEELERFKLNEVCSVDLFVESSSPYLLPPPVSSLENTCLFSCSHLQ